MFYIVVYLVGTIKSPSSQTIVHLHIANLTDNMLNVIPLRNLVVSLSRSQVRKFGASVAEAILREDNVTDQVDSTEMSTIEGSQGEHRQISIRDARKALEEAVDFSVHGPSVQGIQGGHDDLVDVLGHENTKILHSPCVICWS